MSLMETFVVKYILSLTGVGSVGTDEGEVAVSAQPPHFGVAEQELLTLTLKQVGALLFATGDVLQ